MSDEEKCCSPRGECLSWYGRLCLLVGKLVVTPLLLLAVAAAGFAGYHKYEHASDNTLRIYWKDSSKGDLYGLRSYSAYEMTPEMAATFQKELMEGDSRWVKAGDLSIPRADIDRLEFIGRSTFGDDYYNQLMKLVAK